MASRHSERQSNRASAAPAQPFLSAWFPTQLRLLVALAASITAFACSNRTDEAVSAPSVTFRTLGGEQIELATLGKPALVNFWSTTCVICLKEMPDLVALYEDYQPGFSLIAVAMPGDPPNRVLEYAEASDLPFTVAIDVDGSVVAAFGEAGGKIIGTPTSYLISADGQVLDRHVGKMDIQSLRERLDTLLHPTTAALQPASPPTLRADPTQS